MVLINSIKFSILGLLVKNTGNIVFLKSAFKLQCVLFVSNGAAKQLKDINCLTTYRNLTHQNHTAECRFIVDLGSTTWRCVRVYNT